MKKPYWQAIACDLDGTLIGRNHHMNDRDLDALRAARAAGIHIAICTGRNVFESAGPIAALDLTGPGIFVNGTMVCDMNDGSTLAARRIEPRLAENAIDFFGSRGHAVLVLVEDPVTNRPFYLRTDHGPPHRATVEWLLANRLHAEIANDIPTLLRNFIIRLGIVVDVHDAADIAAAIAATFGPRVASHSIYSPYYDCQILEIFAPRVSKWNGIKDLCSCLSLDTSRVIAIGDDVNDISMLHAAALSFAMGNAIEDVKRHAKQLTTSQPHCGVAVVIESLLRGELDPPRCTR